MDGDTDPYRVPIAEAVCLCVPSIVPIGDGKEDQNREHKETKEKTEVSH
jgi:hypothetical protein